MCHVAIRVACQRLGVVTQVTDHVGGGFGGGPPQARRGCVRPVDAAPQVGTSHHGAAQRVEGRAVGVTGVLCRPGVMYGG